MRHAARNRRELSVDSDRTLFETQEDKGDSRLANSQLWRTG